MTMNGTAHAVVPDIAAWSADVFAERDGPDARPVLGPVLARGCITLIAGARGTGKSWLALAMAHAAARGGSLAGWRARKPCRVVLVDAAGSEALLRRRLAALARGEPSPNLVIAPGDAQSSGLPDVASEAGRTALDRLATDADLVVIDGLATLVGPGRGVGSRWAALTGWLRGLRRRNCAVLLVDAAEPRAIAALADTVLRLALPPGAGLDDGVRCLVRVAAARAMAGEDCRRFELRLSLRGGRAAWTRLDDVDHRAVAAWRLHEDGCSSREIARALDVSAATAWRLVERGGALPAHLRDFAALPELDDEDRAREAAARLAAARGRERARVWAASSRRNGSHPPPPRPEPVEGPASGRRDAAGRTSEPASGCGATSSDVAKGEDGAAAAMDGEKVPTANAPEAVKHPPPPLTRAQLQWRMPMSSLLRNCPP